MNFASNNSEECLIVEKLPMLHNQNKGQSSPPFQKFVGEERAYGNTLGTKRLHKEVVNSTSMSPSPNEDANADNSNKAFVTARAKLVFVWLLMLFFS